MGLGAVVGPSQVTARTIEIVIARFHHPIWTKIAATSLVTAGLAALWIGGPFIVLALLLYCAGIGLESIARGTLPLAIFGPERYPVIMGRIAMPSLIAQAVAPTIGALLSPYPLVSGAGSNKLVGNPGTFGAVQRQARPRPKDSTLPYPASASRARWTVRGLTSSASASAELDHASPSASRASTSAWSSSTGGASTATVCAPCGFSKKPRFVAFNLASGLSVLRRRPISTRSRARCDSSASRARKARAISVSRDTSSGDASASARASANSTGRPSSGTTVVPSRTTLRLASTTSASEAINASDFGEPEQPFPIARDANATFGA